MYPAASVSGWYFANPEAKYFGLGKIKIDQVEDLSKKKNVGTDLMAKWLSANLENWGYFKRKFKGMHVLSLQVI